MMKIDHIFIFTADDGKAADVLVNAGFTEGSSRVHSGQGTTNRKFYFDNFFLEILWVHNAAEIKAEPIKSTGLWQRAKFYKNEFSRFGLCMVNDKTTDKLFEHANQYQPNYFPAGKTIAFFKNEDQPSLPWTFRLPFKGQNSCEAEPKDHPNGIKKLTKAIFEYSTDKQDDSFLKAFEEQPQIEFQKTDRNWLTLLVDEGRRKQKTTFDHLNLTIQF